MSAAGLPSARGRRLAWPEAALAAVLLVLAGAAWVVTGERMGGMAAGPGGDLGSLGFYTVVWVTMMAAMMFPSVAPMVVVYDRLRAARRAHGASSTGAQGTAMFVAGYLLTWTAAGVGAYAAVDGVRALDLGGFALDGGGRVLAAAVILAAAAYQLTPVKNVCLTHCRGPFGYLLEHWRDGCAGALRMGAGHGAWCVGCCWALMAALFALGVMSVGWMAVVAALIAIEKLLPSKPAANRIVAVALLALGLAVALVPDRVLGADDEMPPAMEMR